MKTWKKITTYNELKQYKGMKCRCKVRDTYIDDAIIAIEGDFVYICQNHIKGTDTLRNQFGYKYAYSFAGIYSNSPSGFFNGTLEIIVNESEEPIPTEYAVLTNATESAKKQIAEFEQVLAQIKIDAMKLGTRDLARLIKALKAI